MERMGLGIGAFSSGADHSNIKPLLASLAMNNYVVCPEPAVDPDIGISVMNRLLHELASGAAARGLGKVGKLVLRCWSARIINFTQQTSTCSLSTLQTFSFGTMLCAGCRVRRAEM